MPPSRPSVAVAGAGPAGIMAALAAAAHADVILLEAGAEPGRRLLASGGGRCNIANTLPPDQLEQSFGPAARFVKPALRHLPVPRLRAGFAARGAPWTADDGFHYFPASQRARDLLQPLLRDLAAAGARLVTGARALDWLPDRAGLALAGGGEIRADAVIVATGGITCPGLGGLGDGFRLAALAGHTIRPPVPALAGIHCVESWPKDLAGVTWPDAALALLPPAENADAGQGRAKPRAARGTLLFTHRGISGPAALDISGEISRRGWRGSPFFHPPGEAADEAGIDAGWSPAPFAVDWTPATPEAQWRQRLDDWRAERGDATLLSRLRGHAPASLTRVWLRQAGAGEDAPAAALARARREALLNTLKRTRLTAAGVEGPERAMLTRGGVAREEVNPKTLASRLVPNLYFAGEVLDVDGPCGGYNLPWAFASGALAGAAAGRALNPAARPWIWD